MINPKSADETKFQRLWKTKNKDDEWWSSFVTAPIGILPVSYTHLRAHET